MIPQREPLYTVMTKGRRKRVYRVIGWDRNAGDTLPVLACLDAEDFVQSWEGEFQYSESEEAARRAHGMTLPER